MQKMKREELKNITTVSQEIMREENKRKRNREVQKQL